MVSLARSATAWNSSRKFCAYARRAATHRGDDAAAAVVVAADAGDVDDDGGGDDDGSERRMWATGRPRTSDGDAGRPG